MSYRRHSGRSLDPRWMTARFASTCQCGEPIKAGDRIFYYPIGRKAVCESCGKQGQRDLNAEISMELTGGRSDCAFDY